MLEDLLYKRLVQDSESGMRRAKWLILFGLLFGVGLVAGCGSGQTAMPSSEFTEEEKAAIAAEDADIADQEMGGGMAPVKGKKKK